MSYLNRRFSWFFLGVLLGTVTACGSGEPVGDPPISSIVHTEPAGIAPFFVAFSAEDSFDPDGDIVSYEWHFPDGEVKTNSDADHFFTTPGSYSVELVVTDNDGNKSASSVSIKVVGENEYFVLGGVIKSQPFIDVDGDVNDPLADYFNNDGENSGDTQLLSNPVRLNGFASKSPTNQAGDTFADKADLEDHFKVNLRAKDFVSLKVYDYAVADLDLYIYNESTMELVAYSDGPDEFESIRVDEDGTYIVVVSAVKSYSKYLLKVGRSSLLSGLAAYGNKPNFEENQVVLQMHESMNSESHNWYPDKAQIRMTHHQPHRAALGYINPLNPQTHTMLWEETNESGIKGRLAERNPESASKLKTIQAIKHLRGQVGVKHAEPNFRVKGFLTPTDPSYYLQWHHPLLNMPKAWDVTTGDSNVIVALVDSGVYLNHPDLENQLIQGYDFVSNLDDAADGDGIDPDPNDPGDGISIETSSWHGTHVAGIIAAQMGNNKGVVGIAPGVKIMPMRGIGSNGGWTYDILQAVRYAAGLENDSGTLPDQSADVINLSLGGAEYSDASQELYKEVRDRGIIIISAAGNENTSEALYPASYEGIVSVGAANASGTRAVYSNTGPYLDVLAPGGNMGQDINSDGYQDGILSCMIYDDFGSADPAYGFRDGTSMAAPVVAGIAALMKSVYPNLTPDEFDSLLYSGEISTDKGDPGRDNDYGYGVIDGFEAVLAAQRLNSGGTTAAIHSNTNFMVFDSATSSLELNIQAIGNGSIRIASHSASESWLEISDLEVSTEGIGRYEIKVSSDGFSDGNYRAYLEFETDKNTTIRIDVLLRIGNIVEAGNAGFLYVLLIDAAREVVVDSLDLAPIDGLYHYSFEDVPAGYYYVTAGSDIDNNGFVCEDGETCGGYPDSSIGGSIFLAEDLKNVDFTANHYVNMEVQGIQSLFNGYSRLLAK